MFTVYAALASIIGLGLMGAIHACKRYARPGSLLRAQLVDMLLIASLVGVMPMAVGSLIVATLTADVQVAGIGVPGFAVGLACTIAGLWATWRLFRKTVRLAFADLTADAQIVPLRPLQNTPSPLGANTRKAA